MKLEPYSAEIQLPNLAVGLDNIHYDVFLSPRFVEFTRKYLLDLIRQTVNITLLYKQDGSASASTAPDSPSTPRSAKFLRKFCSNRSRGRNSSNRSKPISSTGWPC